MKDSGVRVEWKKKVFYKGKNEMGIRSTNLVLIFITNSLNFHQIRASNLEKKREGGEGEKHSIKRVLFVSDFDL